MHSQAKILVCAALAVPLLAGSSHAQQLLYTIDGHLPLDYFGIDVAGGGDVNGDGVPDVIAGGYRGAGFLGLVRVMSGADGSLLHSITGSPGDALGAAVDIIGDVNSDGYADFADLSLGAGVTLYSGRDGSVLHPGGVSGRD